MASLDPFGYGTHEVLNQAPAMADYDAYSHDPALGKILATFNAEWAAPHASAVGKRVVSLTRYSHLDHARVSSFGDGFGKAYIGRELIEGGWSRGSSGNGPFAGDQISAQNDMVRSRPS